MKVKILKEEGFDIALRGMAYSYKDRAVDPETWWPNQRERAVARSVKLAPMSGGHNKFIRQIGLWIDIEAPRCWWSEFDTYKVGTVAQSESTMHTLSKRAPLLKDFEEGTSLIAIDAFSRVWCEAKGDVTTLKLALPEGYLQRRIVTMNYENLRNIIAQRTGHRLKLWQVFIDQVLEQVEHPEFLKGLGE